MSGIVIVGAGQAGVSLAAKLRTLGYRGPLTLIGEEPAPPYQRPPLSKSYLLGEMDLERICLRAPSYWKEFEINLMLASQVTSIDRTGKTVQIGSISISYDQLALTTGSRPRSIPAAIGGGLAGVYPVRTLADVDAMAREFKTRRRLLIVGGGYIGLEVAAVGAKLGLEVTLVEMAPRILHRVAASETSDFFRKLHSDHGVTIFENVGLNRLTGEGRISGAQLSDGTKLAVDFVIVGIGVTPDTILAERAELDLDNGIRTDAQGRTSDPSIWAAGDCASFPYNGERIRLESVGNAIDHAELVAENILGAAKSYIAKPWFWSDQYDVKLQIAGLNKGYDRIVQRKIEEGSLSIWYYGRNRLLALDAINDARAYMVGKRIIDAGKTLPPECVADTLKDTKSLLSAAISVPQ